MKWHIKGIFGRASRLARRLASLGLAAAMLAPVRAWDLPKEPAIIGNDSQVTVGYGESLYDVARRHGFAMEHLAQANGLPISMGAVGKDSVMLPGRRILPDAPPHPGVVVNLPERGVYVFLPGEQAHPASKGSSLGLPSAGDGLREADRANPRFFPIAIGQPGRFATPTGNFTIVEKVENPDWVAPEWAGLGEDNVVKAGPDNPLGDRWIGLSSSGLGMHATNNPASIGSASSHGCMRMYPEIARVVFDLVRTGWPVRIEYETSRVGLERSGIYVSAFADVYKQVNRSARLRQQFEKQDLLGFYSEAACRPVLEDNRGVPVKLVDMSAKAWYGTAWYPTARLDGALYVEQGVLEAAGVSFSYSLADRSVKLSRDDKSVTLALYVAGDSDRTGDEVFLSRGSSWFPARKAMSGLGLPMAWEAAEKRLRVGP